MTTKFKPGQKVILYTDDRAEVVAWPFFYVPSGGRIVVELVTEGGEWLTQASGDPTVFTPGDGRRYFVKPQDSAAWAG